MKVLFMCNYSYLEPMDYLKGIIAMWNSGNSWRKTSEVLTTKNSNIPKSALAATD